MPDTRTRRRPTPRVILALDPGPEHTAWIRYATDGTIGGFGKDPNVDVIAQLRDETEWANRELAVEMIASYGRTVGAEVFETCVWIGRFLEAWGRPARRVYRLEVKKHITKGGDANDAIVRQALIDRFGPGKQKAIGLKATPGPLYGITGDVWAALGVALTAAETPDPQRAAA